MLTCGVILHVLAFFVVNDLCHCMPVSRGRECQVIWTIASPKRLSLLKPDFYICDHRGVKTW